jgi:hypothetical protein
MRRLSFSSFSLWTIAAAAACSVPSAQSFTAGKGIFLSSWHQQNQHQYQHTPTGTSSPSSALSVATPQEVDAPTASSEGPGASFVGAGTSPDVADLSPLTWDVISKLRFRELHKELNNRHLETTGTTSQLRDRLRQAAQPECIVTEDGIEDDCEPVVSIVSKQ